MQSGARTASWELVPPAHFFAQLLLIRPPTISESENDQNSGPVRVGPYRHPEPWHRHPQLGAAVGCLAPEASAVSTTRHRRFGVKASKSCRMHLTAVLLGATAASSKLLSLAKPSNKFPKILGAVPGSGCFAKLDVEEGYFFQRTHGFRYRGTVQTIHDSKLLKDPKSNKGWRMPKVLPRTCSVSL